MKSRFRYPFDVLKAAVAGWQADRVPRIAAALSYHTLMAVAPLLIVGVGIAGFVLGPTATRERLVAEVLLYTGSEQIAAFVQSIVDQAARPAASTLSTVIGVIVLLWGASSLFSILKLALDDIWDVPEAYRNAPRSRAARRAGRAQPILQFLINRGMAMLMMFATGILLLASVVLTPWLAAVVDRLAAGSLTRIVAEGAAFVLTLLIFAFNFRYLPDIRMPWRDVLGGAAVTAFLFAIGRHVIGLYLNRFAVGSAYGAAGALIVVLLWVYYSAQIFFFGAELVKVVAAKRGARGDLATDGAS